MKIRKKFKKIYKQEFNDPNEAFMEFLFSLIPTRKLSRTIQKGNKYYYKIIDRFLK